MDFDQDLIEILNININPLIFSNGCKEKIMNQKIKDLPADSNKYYIKHEEGTNTFILFVDTDQKEKDEPYQVILNIEKRIERLTNKAEIARLQRLKNCSIKMIEGVGKTYVEL